MCSLCKECPLKISVNSGNNLQIKMSQKIIYVLSNGGGNYYPNNTLTNFTNNFPIPLEVDGKYEVGVQCIGFSPKFKQIFLPSSPDIPSLIISNCKVKDRITRCTDEESGLVYGCDGPVHFDFKDHWTYKCDLIGEKQDCTAEECKYWKYYFDDRTYTYKDLQDLQQKIEEDSGVQMKLDNNRMVFDIPDSFVDDYKYFWVMMHPTFMETFKFQRVLLGTDNRSRGTLYDTIYNVTIGGKVNIERKAIYNGQEYFVYLVSRKPIGFKKYVDTCLVSQKFNLEEPIYPKLIKIVSDNIQPQILNSSYSKDLLIFCPDYIRNENYTFREIECIDFVPLLSNVISSFNIKLLDENDQQLQLQRGHATIIKLILRKMPSNKESFNVRITSTPNQNYVDNLPHKFKVNLPAPITLDDQWKVCVNSISHPSSFATFLGAESTRQIAFKYAENGDVVKYTFKSYFLYDAEELTSELNHFLNEYNIGRCELNLNRLTLFVQTQGTLIFSNFLAKIFGLNRRSIKEVPLILKFFEGAQYEYVEETDEFKVVAEDKIDLSFLKPNYIMMYSNLVKSTVVGGEYTQLLRIAPIKDTDLDYVITEFKHKEFYDLQNFEISTIEIELRAHDGQFINFASSQDIILNLEFSNYQE